MEAAGFEFQAIQAGKLRRYFSLANFLDPFRVAIGLLQSLRIIGRFKPDVVFAKGGYVSLPVVWAAKWRHIPVVIHESDTIPGLANRRAAGIASSIAVAWPPETIRGLPARKLVYTGNPLRDGVAQGKAARAVKRFRLSPHYPVVVILGGSQGSAAINQLVLKALPQLLLDAQVVHQVGDKQLAAVQQSVQSLPPDVAQRYHPCGYLESELFDLYAAADLIISRAGANVLAEIAAAGLPAVLIPLSTAAAGHQHQNATVYAKDGAALVLNETTVTADELNGAVKRLLKNQQRRAEMGRQARQLANFDATKQVADLVWQTGFK